MVLLKTSIREVNLAAKNSMLMAVRRIRMLQMLKSKLLGRDYSEIDDMLIGRNAVNEGRVARISDIAPPQGSPFLRAVKSLTEILKSSDTIYRR